MKELIAFIIMAIVIAVLIEINERRKAKRKKEDCPKEQSDVSACTDCSLVDICEKEKKTGR